MTTFNRHRNEPCPIAPIFEGVSDAPSNGPRVPQSPATPQFAGSVVAQSPPWIRLSRLPSESSVVTTFIVADDGDGDPTLFSELGDYPLPVVSRSQFTLPSYWDALVAAVLAGQEALERSDTARRLEPPRREAPSYGEAEFR